MAAFNMGRKKQSEFPFFQKIVTTPSIEFLKEMVSVAKKEIIIVSPWIKLHTLQTIVNHCKQNINWKVLTRGDIEDFRQGTSDIEAFRFMIDNKFFDLRTLEDLHAKVYVIDNKLSLVTSANLTVAGMQFNNEIGFASQNTQEITDLISIIESWFKHKTIKLDHHWLKYIEQQLFEFKQNEKNDEPPEPFDPDKYFHLEKEDLNKTDGKYRELPLPDSWKPLLDKLKETKNPPSINLFTASDLSEIFFEFFEYLTKSEDDGERCIDILIKRNVKKHTFEVIGQGYGISRQRVEQIIKRILQDKGKLFQEKISEKLQSIITITSDNETPIFLSGILPDGQLPPHRLSQFEMWQFVCSFFKYKFGNYSIRINEINQLLIYDKVLLSRLEDIANFYVKEYQEFLPLKKFFQLGELDKINSLWFHPKLRLIKKIYLADNGTVAARKWSFEKLANAIAWELADKLDWYNWHFSEMREAFYYLDPDRFKDTKVRSISSRLASSPQFHYAGSKGYWQLAELGDGYSNNKEAIRNILLEAEQPLDYKVIFENLVGNGRRVKEASIYALLDREDEFQNLENGFFSLKS